MCREVRHWRVVGGGTLRGGGKMDREEWIKEARCGFGPPPNAGEVAIYGSRAGKDDAAGQLTQLIDGHSNSQTPYHSSYARYGTRERWQFTTISVQHYVSWR